MPKAAEGPDFSSFSSSSGLVEALNYESNKVVARQRHNTWCSLAHCNESCIHDSMSCLGLHLHIYATTTSTHHLKEIKCYLYLYGFKQAHERNKRYCGVRKEAAIWVSARFKAGRFQITRTARTRICIRHALMQCKVASANSVIPPKGSYGLQGVAFFMSLHIITLPHASILRRTQEFRQIVS